MEWNLAVYIAIAAIVTFIIRLLPFAVFSNQTPPIAVRYAGKYLPFAIITGIVLYCFKNVSVLIWPYGLPELMAAALVVILQLYKHSSLISIFGGTALYMFLIQSVFIY